MNTVTKWLGTAVVFALIPIWGPLMLIWVLVGEPIADLIAGIHECLWGDSDCQLPMHGTEKKGGEHG